MTFLGLVLSGLCEHDVKKVMAARIRVDLLIEF